MAQETDYQPQVAEASNAGQLAIQGFRVPDGMEMSLFAAEPMVANPVAFCIDERGRLLVCETFRQQKGVEDNRSHMSWLNDDLALQTVEERLEMFRRHLGDQVAAYGVEHDRIRLIEDTDNDGQADRATVFADGFNDILDGTGAGVLSRRGDVFYTCIPKLWKLHDDNGDGVADQRTALHHGFGVRVAFRGHDMHGLTIGPDGRIYFSIGDRGFNVTTSEGEHLARPDAGAVFRCEPDGSQLEVFAYGLRNPQELAFDDLGNLFTVDNNSDSGDQARLMHVVQDSDTGWRMYFQYLDDRGPWNRERMWHPYRADDATVRLQPAYIVAPIVNLSDGPSGLVAYPGIGLSPRYDGHFLLADFRGSAGVSGIRSFTVKPDGASFQIDDAHEFLWSILATDIDFGYDGNIYLADWVNGWDGEGRGRIYRLHDPASAAAVVTADSAELMRSGFGQRNTAELVVLLSHVDRRIRLEAQFELAQRSAMDVLVATANDPAGQVGRIHAVWGIGQLLRRDADRSLDVLTSLLADENPDVRSQTVRTLSDVIATRDRFGSGHEHSAASPVANGSSSSTSTSSSSLSKLASTLIRLLHDSDVRVRSHAAFALATVGGTESIPPILSLLDDNNNQDRVVRHACSMALTGIGRRHESAVLAAISHNHAAGRLGVLLAMRRLHHPAIAQFLSDPDPGNVVEAARAIHDEPIPAALQQLAEMIPQPDQSDALLRRILAARFELGDANLTSELARVARSSEFSIDLRLEAVDEMTQWNHPPQTDRVTGRWRPLSDRNVTTLKMALDDTAVQLLADDADSRLREATMKLVAAHHITAAHDGLVRILRNTDEQSTLRVRALKSLSEFAGNELVDVLPMILKDDSPALRSQARSLLAALRPDGAVELLTAALDDGTVIEQQMAVRDLGRLESERANTVLTQWIDRLHSGAVPAAIQLDVIEAARARKVESIDAMLADYDARRADADPIERFIECLEGGDVGRGRDVFFGRGAASCRRCHKVYDEGGEVGPDLSKVAKERKRRDLLESIVDPNRQIAKGFETSMLLTDDGHVHVGIVREEDDDTIQLMTPTGAIVLVHKDSIEERAKGKSGMPEDLVKNLTRTEIRDLVEYLSRLDGSGPDTATTSGHE